MFINREFTDVILKENKRLSNANWKMHMYDVSGNHSVNRLGVKSYTELCIRASCGKRGQGQAVDT